MASVYCEFCGAEVGGIRSPERFIRWTHNELRDVVRCAEHRRTSKRSKLCRTIDPYTGQKAEKPLYRIK